MFTLTSWSRRRPTRRAPLPTSPFVTLAVLALLLLVVSCGGCGSGSWTPPDSGIASGGGEVAGGAIRILVVGDDEAGSLADTLGAFRDDFRRFAEGWTVEIVPRATLAEASGGLKASYGPEVSDGPEVGDALEVVVTLLPAPEAVAGLVGDFPVDLSSPNPRLAGSSYDGAALALELPTVENGAPPRWLVAGADRWPVATLTAEVVLRGTGLGAGGWDDDVTYMVRASQRKRRSGTWARGADGVQAVDTRDDFAEAAEWFAGLEAQGSGSVRVLAAPSSPFLEPEAGRRSSEAESAYSRLVDPRGLANRLSQAVDEMLPRLGGQALGPPLTVALERDHVEQIRHTDRVGEAVAGGPADVHAVPHPADGFALRHAVALALMRRASLLEPDTLPPYLAAGAALWLADPEGSGTNLRWYGRSWRHWLPVLASAEVLPTVDELLAREVPADGSFLLWTPLAAAVVESLPGDTLAEKLALADERRPAAERLLRSLDAASVGDQVPASSVRRDPVPPFLAGVSLAMLNDHALGYQSPSVDTALVHLEEALGANAVSLMPFAYQPAPDQPELRYLNSNPGSETDIAMIHAGRRAHERGFTVLWKPQIWLRGSWPGEVEMTRDGAWETWFRSYRRFMVHQAVLARWVGAEIVSVGVELGRTMDREDDWRRVIAAVRQVYDGPLVYSANWYGDFDQVPFWDAMDYLGIDAYEPLSDDPQADDAALAAGARRVVANLAERAARHGKPLLLTEVGFAAHEAAWVAPHEEGGPLSVEDQARSYRALLNAMGRPDWLGGAFVWKVFSNAAPATQGGRSRSWTGRPAGEERADFRFLHRPAEEVVESYYRAGN